MARKAAISTAAVDLSAPRASPPAPPPKTFTRAQTRELVRILAEEESELTLSLTCLLFGFESINSHAGLVSGRVIAPALIYRVLSEHLEKMRESYPGIEAQANGSTEALVEAAHAKPATMHEEDD